MSEKIRKQCVNAHFKPKKFNREKKILYSKSVDVNSNCIYTKRCEVDEFADIQSYKDQCSLSTILSKLAYVPADQVVSSLQMNNGFSADMSHMPTDLNEYIDIFNRLKTSIPGFEEKLKTMTISQILEESLEDFISKNEVVPVSGSKIETESEGVVNGSNE